MSILTLWTLCTCRIAGTLAYTRILITASLSSTITILPLHDDFEQLEEQNELLATLVLVSKSVVFTRVSFTHPTFVSTGSNTFIIKSHKSYAGIPSIPNPMSETIISASFKLWDMRPCPTKHKDAPGEDLLPLRSPAELHHKQHYFAFIALFPFQLLTTASLL